MTERKLLPESDLPAEYHRGRTGSVPALILDDGTVIPQGKDLLTTERIAEHEAAQAERAVEAHEARERAAGRSAAQARAPKEMRDRATEARQRATQARQRHADGRAAWEAHRAAEALQRDQEQAVHVATRIAGAWPREEALRRYWPLDLPEHRAGLVEVWGEAVADAPDIDAAIEALPMEW